MKNTSRKVPINSARYAASPRCCTGYASSSPVSLTSIFGAGVYPEQGLNSFPCRMRRAAALLAAVLLLTGAAGCGGGGAEAGAPPGGALVARFLIKPVPSGSFAAESTGHDCHLRIDATVYPP